MRNILFLLLLSIGISCNTAKDTSSSVAEDEMFITRKYIGTFKAYRLSEPELVKGTNIMWIKTSKDSIYGKIAAFGNKCDFVVGERLYLRRVFNAPAGSLGYWEYQIENNSSISYSISDYQRDKKVVVNTWFEMKQDNS